MKFNPKRYVALLMPLSWFEKDTVYIYIGNTILQMTESHLRHSKSILWSVSKVNIVYSIRQTRVIEPDIGREQLLTSAILYQYRP